jgi:hypothetical protein
LIGGAFFTEFLRVSMGRACIYFDWGGARIIPSAFEFLNVFGGA